jgi:hypothetical protein
VGHRAGLETLKERTNLMTLPEINQKLLCDSSHNQLTTISEISGLIEKEVFL